MFFGKRHHIVDEPYIYIQIETPGFSFHFSFHTHQFVRKKRPRNPYPRNHPRRTTPAVSGKRECNPTALQKGFLVFVRQSDHRWYKAEREHAHVYSSSPTAPLWHPRLRGWTLDELLSPVDTQPCAQKGLPMFLEDYEDVYYIGWLCGGCC